MQLGQNTVICRHMFRISKPIVYIKFIKVSDDAVLAGDISTTALYEIHIYVIKVKISGHLQKHNITYRTTVKQSIVKIFS